MKIPLQLQKKDVGFVLLGKWDNWGKYEIVNGKQKLVETKIFKPSEYDKLTKEKIWKSLGKAPFEPAWQKNSYKYKNPRLLNHKDNIGVIGGYGNIRIIDCDNPLFAKQIENRLKTYQVKTGTGGMHFYIICNYNTNHVFIKGYGELRANNYQVVSPPSRHPNGKKYTIVNNLPIKKLTIKELKEIIEPYLRKEDISSAQVNEIDYSFKEILEKDYNIKNLYVGNFISEKYPKEFPIDKDINISKLLKFNSPSEAELSLVCRLISINLDKEQIFKVMASCKLGDWQKKPIQYREMTYKKAVAKITKKKEKIEDPINLPNIMLPQENKVIITEFIEEIVKLLKNKRLFYRIADDSIIEICNGKLKIVTPVRMVTLIESVCIPCIERWNDYKKQTEIHKKTTNEQVCKILLASPTLYENLKEIEKILFTPVPILKDDKLIFPKRGYNEELKLYLDETAPEITELDMNLNKAKEVLFGIFEEFCFKEDDDGIKALLSLLTPFIRGLYKDWNTRTPLFIYFANRERAGKDYLATIRGLLFEGQAIEEPPICTGKGNTNQNEELRKKILSSLSIGRQFLHFSNNKGFINNSILEQIITTKVFSDRILGGNKIATFQNNLEISLSGNIGTTLTSDLNYRSVIINLFLAMENVNERKFKRPNLHYYIEENRGKILSALYCLIKNWFDNGMKKSKILFTSFPEWAEICGGIIEAAGFTNPLQDKNEINITMDRELSEMKLLFEYLHEFKGGIWVKKNEIKNIIRGDDEVEIFPYLDFNEKSDQIRFGFLLDKYKGRELSGIKMIVDETIKTKHKQKYKFTMEEIVEEKQLELSKVFNIKKSG